MVRNAHAVGGDIVGRGRASGEPARQGVAYDADRPTLSMGSGERHIWRDQALQDSWGRIDRILRNGRPGATEGLFSAIGDAPYSPGSMGLSGIQFVRPQLPGKAKITQPYRENVWVRVCIKEIVQRLRQLPIGVWSGDPKEEGSERISHPLDDLLARPSTITTWQQLVEQFVVDYNHEESFFFLINASGKPCAVNEATERLTEPPVAIVPVRGQYVEHDPDQLGWPLKFRYSTGRRGTHSEWFHRSSVLHFKAYDPYSHTRGMGTIRALLYEIDTYYQAQRYTSGNLQNGGDPGAWIVYDQMANVEELDRRQEEIDDALEGHNAGRYKVLSGAKVVPNPVRPKDMEWNTLQEGIRNAILAEFGVPPPIVGVYDNATFNNILTAERIMWTGPVLGHAGVLADPLTNRLLWVTQDLEEWRVPDGARVSWDTTGIEALNVDRVKLVEMALQISKAGTGITFNEAARIVGLEIDDSEDDSGAEVGWVSSSMVPLDRALEENGKPAPMPQIAPQAAVPKAGPAADKPKGKAKQKAASGAPSDVQLALMPDDWRRNGDPEVRASVEGWLDGYGDAQLRRLSVLANGRSASGALPGRTYALDDEIDVITEDIVQILLLSQDEWSQRLFDSVEGPWTEVVGAGISAAHLEVGGSLIGLTDPRVLAFIAEHVPRLSEGVSSTLAKRIQGVLMRHLGAAANGRPGAATLRELLRESLPPITKDLRSAYSNNHQRALAIARTETGKAHSGAKFLQYRDSGVVEIEWVSMGDDVVRDSHEGLNGRSVQLGHSFLPGVVLRHPHDTQAPVGEVVNCRCDFRAKRFEDDQ